MTQNIQSLKENVYKSSEKKPKIHPLILGFFVLTVIFIVLASLLSIFTPQTVDVVQTSFTTLNLDQSQTKFTGVLYTGPQIDIPPKLAIAKPQVETQTIATLTQALITRFDLTASADVDQYWSSNDYVLTKNPYLETYTFDVHHEAEDQDKTFPLINKEDATTKASDFLRQLIPTIELTLQPQAAKPILMSHEYSETTADKATALEVPFAPVINGLPVFYKKESQFPFRVLIDSNLEVHKLTFYPHFTSYQPFEDKNTISIEQAVSNIQSGKGSIIDATFDANELSLSDLTNAELRSVSLEYREDAQLNLAYPFYHFIGKATTKAEATAEVEIITPAIQTSVPAKPRF